MTSPPLSSPNPTMAETTTTLSDSGDANGASTAAATIEYFGWVYHVGINSIGHEYCHVRFIFIRGKHVEMYKRDPHLHPGIKPIRRGVMGPTLMVEEVGRRKVPHGEVHILRFYNRLDESKKGEIACATAEEAHKWVEAFGQSKQQAEYELLKAGSSARNKLSIETEINLDEHRPRVRRYASGLKKLIKIGQGPEFLLNPFSNRASSSADGLYERDSGDAVETYHWKCVRTINGVRIFEDVANSENGRGVIVKAVGVIQTSAHTAFDVLLNLDKHQRYEWDMLTGDLELLDSYDGHYDVVYGTFDPRYLTRWHSKRDFIFSRQWFRGQDGTYTILHFPAVHKKKPPRSGYRRIKLNPSTWEIRNLNSCMGSDTPRCLIMQMLEMNSAGWGRWKKSHCSKFERSVPYAMLCLVGGLKEYIGADPALKSESSGTLVQTKLLPVSSADYYEANVKDEFYDAISTDSLSSDEEESDDDDDDDDDDALDKTEPEVKLNKITESDANKELDSDVAPISIDLSQFPCSCNKGKDDADTNCWSTSSGKGFMIRGKNYLKDNSKVTGGEPLLNLIGTDWFKVDKPMDNVALHPRCLVQDRLTFESEAGKKLPFILVINLQIPAKPNYSLVLYYAADRPPKPESLFTKFVDGDDMFRNTRFKLIPSIIEGYWMVKRAVGTKACLLGKAVTCNYLRQDNFLEIDVDIGSSTVAKSVIGLVLGYVTSIVVDLAILIEAKEEEELPEYILGTVRLNRLNLESAVHLEEAKES